MCDCLTWDWMCHRKPSLPLHWQLHNSYTLNDLGGQAYVIGESGLPTALHAIGYVLTNQEPEYVVLGETLIASNASPRPFAS